VSSKSRIYKKVIAYYRHFDIDKYSEEAGSSLESFENDFVTNLIGENARKENQVYLYELNGAQHMAQKFGFIHSLTHSIVKVQGKMNFFSKQINDKMYIAFKRLYYRFGSASDRGKIGIISKISKSGTDTVVAFSDLGNIFNRAMVISPTGTNDFSSATKSEKIKYSFIVDTDTELPDTTSEDEWGSNQIT